MEKEKIDMFMMSNAKFFPEDKNMFIREKLEALDDEKYSMLLGVELKNPTTLLLISIFVGEFGVDRFMLGDTGMGILKLLTGGLCGILYLIDIFNVSKKTKEANFNKIMQLLA